MKYRNTEIAIDKALWAALAHKRATFLAATRTKKAARTVLVTTYGVLQNEYSDAAQAVVTMDDLFQSA